MFTYHLITIQIVSQGLMNKTILALFLMIQMAYSQTTTSTRVLGLGLGTFIIIVAIIFSIVCCLASRNCSKPEVWSLLGLLVPGILILAFAVTPKTSQVTTTSIITDDNFIPHFFFMVLAFVGFVIPGGYVIIKDAFTYKKAKNVARSAFRMREQEEELLVDQPMRSQLELESNAQTQNMPAVA